MKRRALLLASGTAAGIASIAGCSRLLGMADDEQDETEGNAPGTANNSPPEPEENTTENKSEDDLEAANPEPEPTNEPNESDYATPEEVNETRPRKENITISNKNLTTSESSATATGTLTNENEEMLDVVDIEVTFLDKQNNPITTAWWGTSDLGAGETWNFEVTANGAELSNADDFDVRIVL